MTATEQSTATSPPKAARVATWLYFGLNGFAVGMWVVHIPSIEHSTGITHSMLGLLLLVLGCAAFLAMQVAGPLVDRLGQRRLVPASGVLLGIALAGPGLATNWWTLGLALILIGVGNGSIDVGMNAQAVVVERAYGRPIMAAFHAMWSIGGAIAALVGAATLRAGVPTELTLVLAGVICIVISLIARQFLLEPEVAKATDDKPAEERSKPPAKLVWALGGLAFGLMLSEGVANDWAALQFKDILGTSVSMAAYAYGAFAVAMTVGRFLTDRVAAIVGPAAIVRWGAAMAAVGLTVVIVVPSVPIALAGWAVFGLGLAGGVPQLFTAAGNLDPASAGALMARVVGLGYVGLLAGPALIGGLAHWMPLNLAFILPVALCVLTFFGGPVLKKRS
jgi:MFS family permease